MKKTWKRVTAGLLAFAVVAGTVTADFELAELFGTSAVVAQAVDHTKNDISNLCDEADNWLNGVFHNNIPAGSDAYGLKQSIDSARNSITQDMTSDQIESVYTGLDSHFYLVKQEYSVTYLNENGESRAVTEYTVLTGEETPNANGDIILQAGIYVVNSDIAYERPILLNGDVRLILCDNASLSIGGESKRENNGFGTVSDSEQNTLSIYSQSTGQAQGKMSVYTYYPCITRNQNTIINYKQYGGDVLLDSTINGFNCISGALLIQGGKLTAKADHSHAIYAGLVTIIGGEVTAVSNNNGIYACEEVRITGGEVTAEGRSDAYGITSESNVIIAGGKVTAKGQGADRYGINGRNVHIDGGQISAAGICAYDGNISLSLENATDYVLSSSYSALYFKIESGLTLYAGTTPLTGTINNKDALNGRRITTAPILYEFDAASNEDLLGKGQYEFPDTKTKSIKKIEVLMDIESFAENGWGQVIYQNGNEDDQIISTRLNTLGIHKYTVDKGQLNDITFAGVRLVGKGKLLAYTITYADNTTATAGSWNYPVYTAPEAKKLTYTGSAQALVTAGTATGGTMQYAVTDNTVTSSPVTGWTASVPTGKNAGTYRVWYMVDGDAEHIDSEAHYTDVTIAKADPTVTAPTARTLTYTGQPQALMKAGKATNGTMYYGLTVDPTVHKADGKTLTVNIADLKAGDVLQVTQKDASKIGFTGGTVKYRDSQGEVALFEYDYMAYSYYSSIQPYHYIELGESGSGGTLINNETYNAMIVASNDGSTVMLEAYNYTDGDKTTVWYDSVPTGTDAGIYPVCYKVVGDDNHNDIAPTLIGNVEIGKASAVKTAPTAKNPVRENNPVQLINAGEAQTGCTIEYQLGTSATAVPTGEWTTDVATITANSSGTYYVWYKATGDGQNCDNAAPKCLTVKVTQAQLWTIEMPDYVYDGTAHEPTIKGMTFGKLTYTYFTSAGICIGSTAPTEPGDYRVSVAASGDETHPSKLESAYYTIKGAKFAAGNTVSFKEKVEFNFLVEATDAETVEGAYVVFTYDHYGEKMTVKKPINKDDMNGKYYRVRLPLTASEMAIDIKAELYLPTLDKPVDTKTRSIKDYAEAAIKSNLDGAEVLKAMLNYGGYTQTALGNNTTLLANSGEGIAVDVSSVAPKSATPFVRPTATGAKVTYKGSTAMTTSDLYVRHYFTVDSSMTASELNTVMVKVGDNAPISMSKLKKNNIGYYCEMSPELAYELDRENGSVVVYGFAGAETADSENAISIENYNVIDYCEAVAGSNKQTTEAKNMVKAMYSYYTAAKAYVESRS